MTVLADPMVRAKLKEFRGTVDALVQTPNLTDEDRVAVIRELCELSRSTKFGLGPVEYAQPEQVEEVASCFEESARRLRALWNETELPANVEKYCLNIEQRARWCRGEL